MSQMPWYRKTWGFLAICLVLPPAGLALMWLRPTCMARTLLVSLGLIVLTFAHLFWFYGLHVELDGTGMRPIFTFRDSQSHYTEIEENRRQRHTNLSESYPDTPKVTEPVTKSGVSEKGVSQSVVTEVPVPIPLGWVWCAVDSVEEPFTY